MIFCGSKPAGCDDLYSDQDVVAVLSTEGDERKYFCISKEGLLIDLHVYSLNIINSKVLSSNITSDLKDELLLSPYFRPMKGQKLDAILENGREKFIEDFLIHLMYLSGKVPTTSRVLFNLDSVLEWPIIKRFMYAPLNRYGIARKKSGSGYGEFLKKKKKEFKKGMTKFIKEGLVREMGENQYEYLGERGKKSIYLSVFSNFLKKGLELQSKLLNDLKVNFSRSKDDKEVYFVNIDTDTILKIKRKLLEGLEYLNVFFLMTQFGFNKKGNDYIYKGISLDRITKESRSYEFIRAFYHNLRKMNFIEKYKQVSNQGGLVRVK